MVEKTFKSGLKLVYWNANGVLSKKHELLNFLNEEGIDVMLLGET